MNGIFGKKLKNLNMDSILDGKAELLMIVAVWLYRRKTLFLGEAQRTVWEVKCND